MFDDLRFVDRGIVVLDNGRRDFLPKGRVGNAEGGRRADPGKRLDGEVDLHRRKLLAAPMDEIFDAAFHKQVPVVIEMPQIARATPAVHECRGRGLWIVEISLEHRRAPHHDFTGFAGMARAPASPSIATSLHTGRPTDPCLRTRGGNGSCVTRKTS